MSRKKTKNRKLKGFVRKITSDSSGSKKFKASSYLKTFSKPGIIFSTLVSNSYAKCPLETCLPGKMECHCALDFCDSHCIEAPGFCPACPAEATPTPGGGGGTCAGFESYTCSCNLLKATCTSLCDGGDCMLFDSAPATYFCSDGFCSYPS